MISGAEESGICTVQERAELLPSKTGKDHIGVLSSGEVGETLILYCSRASEIPVLPITIVNRQKNKPSLKDYSLLGSVAEVYESGCIIS
jgi:hypothetical protein